MKGFLGRLKIKIDAFATNPPRESAPHEHSAPTKELVNSVTIKDEDDPEVVIGEEDDGTASTSDDHGTTTSRYVCLLWRKQIDISKA